tara:strand:- start:74 stop:403 length:330 start_codon:yes stop_codon:yes gene_type:complete
MSNLKMKEQEAWLAYIDATVNHSDAAMYLRQANYHVSQYGEEAKLIKSRQIARDAYDVTLANTQVKRKEYEVAADNADKEGLVLSIRSATAPNVIHSLDAKTKNPWRSV